MGDDRDRRGGRPGGRGREPRRADDRGRAGPARIAPRPADLLPARRPEPGGPRGPAPPTGAGGGRGSRLPSPPIAPVLGGLAALAVVALLAGLAWLWNTLPDPTELDRLRGEGTVDIRFADGSRMALVGKRPGPLLDLRAVPPSVSQGFLATEDRNFVNHTGVDYRGLARAFVADLHGGREGASTITEQLAKNYFFQGVRRTPVQKLRELVMAVKIERTYSKAKILAAYLTIIPYGRDLFGVADAARYYYGKDLSQVSLGEAATIVGAANAITPYNPRTQDRALGYNPLAWSRAQKVLRNMLAAGEIDQNTYAAAVAAGPPPVAPPAAPEPWRYAVDRILKSYRLTDQASERHTELVVTSTLDRGAQAAAEAAVRDAVGATPDLDAVLVALDGTGAVKAFVNSKQYYGAAHGYADEPHQIGSLMKAFIYAAAFGEGARADDTCDDVPGAFGDRGQWRPGDDDGHPRGRLPLVTAFAISSNLVAARVAAETGHAAVADLLARVRMRPPPPAGIAAWPLSAEATPMEVARGFLPFANGGFARTPRFVASIVDSSGARRDAPPRQGDAPVIDGATLSQEHRLTRAVVTLPGATALRAAVDGLWVGGKTGTTSSNKDVWFAGYGDGFVVVVWVGRPRDQKSMRGVWGGTLPAGVFHAFMAAQKLGWGAKPPAGWVDPAAAPPAPDAGRYYHGLGHPPPGQGCQAGA